MNPLENNVRGHASYDTRIMTVFGQTKIGCMAVRDQCCAWSDASLDESVDVNRLVAGNGSEPDASGQGIEILRPQSPWGIYISGGAIDDLDGPNDEYLAGFGDLEKAVIGAERHL